MSFVAFNANFAGTPPAPFVPFDSGEPVFYLVGVAAADPFDPPAPATQLSVSKRKSRGSGRRPTDTVVETAKGWQGRRRVTVATRSYSWERYTRGALASARDAAQWQSPTGEPLSIWCHVVTVADADYLGYRVPGGSINARRGSRGVGHENNARGTVQGQSIVQAAQPAPIVQASQPSQATGLCGRRLPYSRLTCDQPAGHSGVCSDSVDRAPVAPVEAAIASLHNDGLRVAPMLPSQPTPHNAVAVDAVHNGETVDPSIARFRLLDLDTGRVATPEPVEDTGPGRVPMID